jgi:monoamine oxidase
VNRREVIKQLGLGVSGGIIIPSWLSGCSEDDPVPIDNRNTVAIVGAGAAGLYAADILKAQGLKVVLLEASDRVGGRVRTLKSNDAPSQSLIFNSMAPLSSDFPNELGAGQVLGSDSVWGKIVGQLGITTVNIPSATTDNYIVENALMDSSSIAGDPDFIAAKNFFTDIQNYSGGNVSVQQAIENSGLSARMHGVLNAWIGNKFGTSNDSLSMLALSEAMALKARDNSIITLTDNPMQDALLSRYSNAVTDVLTRHQVTSINHGGGQVEVAGTNTESSETFSFTVDRVIVTVPISVLKAGTIAFSPALPSNKTAALGKMGMDAMIRVLLDFKANFWGTDSGFLYGGASAPEYFNSGAGRSIVTKTLAVTVGGAKAAALSPLGKGMIPVLLAELDGIYGGDATFHIRKDNDDNDIAVLQDWSLEPYVKGGVSYMKPGGVNQDRVDLALPVNDRLFFAGEATDILGESGTVNGALQSAERVAQEVLNSFS